MDPTKIPLFSGFDELRKYRKCRPSGKNCGQRCVVSPAVGRVTTVACPPPAGHSIKPGPLAPKRITPSWFQDPPCAMVGISQTVCGGPPAISIFFNLPE